MRTDLFQLRDSADYQSRGACLYARHRGAPLKCVFRMSGGLPFNREKHLYITFRNIGLRAASPEYDLVF